jgi:DNA polymerase-3 subunit epsilon
MYLFFDVETNGLPLDWKAPLTDLNNWPEVLQLALVLCDDSGEEVQRNSWYVKPEKGFKLNENAAEINKITLETLEEKGVPIEEILAQFALAVEKAEQIVAHNIEFDENIIGAEFLRAGLANVLEEKNKICTMVNTVKFCNIPGKYGPKWPSLLELHVKLFDEGFKDAHDALVDTDIVAKCFWELITKELL